MDYPARRWFGTGGVDAGLRQAGEARAGREKFRRPKQREVTVMRRLLSGLLMLVLLLAVAVGGVGYYRGWYNVATAPNPETGQRSIQVNIDEDKVKSDAQKAKATVSGAVSGGASQAKEPEK